jgi:DNA-binding GntR family transcriptional regulator
MQKTKGMRKMAEVIEIARLQLHDQVAARLRIMLIEGRIQPGDKLNERELCDRLRVSRTPLREAIKLLAAEGLVDLLPNRGAVAVKLSEGDVIDTFEVLAELEGLSGELAAQRATDPEIAEVKAMHYEMLAWHARGDLSNYYRLNAAIHLAFNDAARNPVLQKTYRAVNARVQSHRFRTNLHEANWKLAVKEHGIMVECLVARDSAGLRAVLVQHVFNKRDTVLELMRSGVPQPAPAQL